MVKPPPKVRIPGVANVTSSLVDKDAWILERKNSIGSSDDVGSEKAVEVLAKIKAGLKEGFSGNVHTEAGNILEDAILQGWSKKFGVTTQANSWIQRRKGCDWMHATPDGFIMDGKKPTHVVEIKAPGLNGAEYWLDMPRFKKTNLEPRRVVSIYQRVVLEAPRGSNPPRNYYTQVQRQLHITGLDEAYLVAMLGGKRIVWFEISRDQGFIDEQVELCRKAMGRVRELQQEVGNKDDEKITNKEGER